MPVPSVISDLSQTAASNYPAGSDSPATLDDTQRAHASFIALHRDGRGFAQDVTLASAATTEIGTQNSLYVQISGTTTITSFGTNYNGPRILTFTGALTLTHNATTLILPGAANITTAAGDTCLAVPVGNAATGWRVVSYQRGDGVPFTGVSQLAGLRNKIINGKMEIAQRGTSFAAIANGSYSVDRWLWQNTTAAAGTLAQNTGLIPSVEFQASLSYTVTTADASIAAGDTAILSQRIEGYNARDLYGRTFTLSFKVRSAKTGVHCIALRRQDFSLSYVAEYTIAAANVWQDVSLTVLGGLPGATGTWNWTSGVGVEIAWSLANGSTRQTSAGAWQAGDFMSTAAQVNVLDTVGNVFAITGVQLEVGSVATPFEHRPVGLELALCQRYYEKSFHIATAPAQAAGEDGSAQYPQVVGASAASMVGRACFVQRKRSAPSIVVYNPQVANAQVYNPNATASWSATTVEGASETGFNIQATSAAGSAGGHRAQFHWTASAEL